MHHTGLSAAARVPYIRKVSVLEENTIRIEGYVDPVSPVSGYELLRAASAAGPFTSIAFKSDDGTDRVVFFDNPSTEQVWYLQDRYHRFVRITSQRVAGQPIHGGYRCGRR